MFAAITNTSDNYVKLDKERTKRKIARRRSDARMIIKLAYYNDPNQQEDIRECCESNGSLFIPLFENKFGILTKIPWVPSYGKTSTDEAIGFGVKAFIDIYNCVDKREKSKWRSKLWKSDAAPYNGELLDNKFFLNILFIISNDDKNAIELNHLRVVTKSGEFQELEDLDEIKMGIKKSYIKRILILSFNLGGQDITVNKNGYIDISSNEDFFAKNSKMGTVLRPSEK